MNSDNSIRFSVGLLDRSSDKEKASRYGRMAQCTKAGGWTAKPMVKAVSSMLMVMYMTECGLMIRHMVMVFTAILTEQNTKEIGLRISSMVRELRLGQTVQNMTVFTFMERNMDLEGLLGRMEVRTMGSLKRTIYKDRALTTGLMEGCSSAPGSITKWKVPELSRGLMAGSTRANMSMIRKRVRAPSTGPTAENTKEAGATANSTATASTPLLVAKSNRASGMRVRE